MGSTVTVKRPLRFPLFRVLGNNFIILDDDARPHSAGGLVIGGCWNGCVGMCWRVCGQTCYE